MCSLVKCVRNDFSLEVKTAKKYRTLLKKFNFITTCLIFVLFLLFMVTLYPPK